MRIKLVAGAFALAIGITACGGDSYSKEDAIADLKEAGMTDEQANCVVDAAENEFGIEKLNSNDDLTDEDEAKITELTMNCMGLGG